MEKHEVEAKVGIAYAFMLSLLFVCIDGVVYVLLSGPLDRLFHLDSLMLNNLAQSFLLSVLGTLLGCSAFFLCKKQPRRVVQGYCFFLLYLLITYAFCFFEVEAGEQPWAYQMITVFLLPPTVTGIAGSALAYRAFRRRAEG